MAGVRLMTVALVVVMLVTSEANPAGKRGKYTAHVFYEEAVFTQYSGGNRIIFLYGCLVCPANAMQ